MSKNKLIKNDPILKTKGHSHTNISPPPNIEIPTGSRAQNAYDSMIEAGKEKQRAIEAYNKVLDDWNKDPSKIDPRFKEKVYLGSTVVVRLYKEDYMDNSNPKFPIVKANKVPAVTPSNKQIMVDNPLPYLFIGVICAMSEHAKEQYKELKVGDKVDLTAFDLKADRYYLDKANIDLVRELVEDKELLPNYEGYALLHPSVIEAKHVTK